jgi:two-component system, OmpR family, sensor histidine kinase VanS
MPRLPPMTVRLRLTLLYGGLFLLSGLVLLAVSYLIFRGATGVNLIVQPGAPGTGAAKSRELAESAYAASVERNTDALHRGLFRSLAVLAALTVVSIAFGWLVAGRVLRPLRTMTATTRQISERNLNERLDLPGPRDELKDLADTIDGLLARLEAHVAEQQRFAANASHELRTPLATTQALLEVARKEPGRADAELLDRLHAVNARAIDLTEALLLLSRADQRSFERERVDLSLVAEEAVETLLPMAEERGVAIEVDAAGEGTATRGSHPLLLQLATNLVHNAIVHNLPAAGTVWVTTAGEPAGAEPGAEPGSVTLTVENTGPELSPATIPTLTEPFLRGTERTRADHPGVGLGLAIVKSIAGAHDAVLTLTPHPGGGLRVTARFPAA